MPNGSDPKKDHYRCCVLSSYRRDRLPSVGLSARGGMAATARRAARSPRFSDASALMHTDLREEQQAAGEQHRS
jgi:outer membrane usher protein FimD/PapC